MLEGVKEFISDSVEFVRLNKGLTALGLIGALAAGGASYKNENYRDANIPLAFSEKHQIHNDARYKNETVPPFTEVLTSINDASMKVFEAWNLSHTNSFMGQQKKFAQELEIKKDPSLNYHYYALDKLLANIPQEGANAASSFMPFILAANDVIPVNDHFDRAWDDSHIDTTHLESYECGTSEHPQTCFRTVYDYTTHSYDYYKNEGEAAAKGLSGVLLKFNDLQFTEKLGVPSQTNAEGEYAIEKTNKIDGQKGRFSPAQLMQFATRWNKGSTLNQNLPAIMNAWNALRADSPVWNQAKETAHNDSYITYSHYDSGPREFQVAETALDHGNSFVKNIAEIVNGLNYARVQAPELNKKIEQYVSIVLDKQPKYKDVSKKPNELAAQIMGDTRRMYLKNIKAGLDVEGFRWYMVLLSLFGGGMLGAGLGYALDERKRRQQF